MELPLIGSCGAFMGKAGISAIRGYCTKFPTSIHQIRLGTCILYQTLLTKSKLLGIVGPASKKIGG